MAVDSAIPLRFQVNLPSSDAQGYLALREGQLGLITTQEQLSQVDRVPRLDIMVVSG